MIQGPTHQTLRSTETTILSQVLSESFCVVSLQETPIIMCMTKV